MNRPCPRLLTLIIATVTSLTSASQPLPRSAPATGQNLTRRLHLNGQVITLPCGHHAWQPGRAPLLTGTPMGQYPDEPTAGRFAWPGESTCAIKLCACETPFQMTFTLNFQGDELTLAAAANASFTTTQWPALVGQAAQ